MKPLVALAMIGAMFRDTKLYRKRINIMTNRKFSETDNAFIKNCELAGIPATKRQASKYRMRKGLAYNFFKNEK